MMPVQAFAVDGQCYRLEFDYAANERPNWTLTIVGNDLEWDRDGEKVLLIAGSGGSGHPVRQALEPKALQPDAKDDDGIHNYRMVGDKLVFDMEVYEPGCN